MSVAQLSGPAMDEGAGIIQVVRSTPGSRKGHGWESFGVFAAFTIGYIWFGEWLVVDTHVVGFTTLDHLERALMIWHNNPAKLSAIGPDYPPLSTIFLAPLTILPSWAMRLSIVPLASAPFAGAVIVLLNTAMRRIGLSIGLRLVILVVLACNPLFALYASDGAADLAGLTFAIGGFGSLVAWYLSADIRYVLLSGLTFAVGALTGYENLLWFAVGAVGILVVLSRHGARDAEMEGTLAGFAVPTVFAVGLWSLLSVLLSGKPFGWVATATDAVALPLSEIPRDTGLLLLDGAPLAIIVLPALVIVGLSRGNAFAIWCASLIAAAIVLPGVLAALGASDSPMAMRNALPVLLFSIIGAVWLMRLAGPRSVVTQLGLIALMAASIPWTFAQMKDFPQQSLESSFVAAVSTHHSQEGARTLDGKVVGVADEENMGQWILSHIHGTGTILTDNAQTYAVILNTGNPSLFFDRVDRSDGPWLKTADSPAGKVRYLLLSRGNPSDLLSQRYPQAAEGSDSLLPVIHKTRRYVLVAVPAGYQRVADPTTPFAGGNS